MTNDEAWSILDDALDRCREVEDLQTAEVYAALKHLSAQAQAVPGGEGVHWPFRLFWEQMAAKGEGFRAEGRWQQSNAALRGMRLRVTS
jgi:hypothetical protein